MRAIRIDLSTGQSQELTPPAAWRRLLLGGRGWAARLLADLSPDISPLAPENPILLTAGPLAGTAAMGAGGVWVSSLSPLTGLVAHGWAAGDWGAALRQTGFDLVILTGECAEWSVLELTATPTVRAATGLVGLDTLATDAALRGRTTSLHTMTLGIAGERGAAYAVPVIDGSYLVEPAGVGVVMGRKRLKAITVSHGPTIAAADPATLRRVDQSYAQHSAADPLVADFVRFGSAMYVNLANDRGAVTARNGQDGVFKGMLALSRTTLASRGKQTGGGCANGPVPCHAAFTTRDGTLVARPELTALIGFGARCGIADLETVVQANQKCVRLGLDVTATSAAIAFLMECQQRGLHSSPALAWGDSAAVLDTIDQIANKKGVGGVLSLGVGEMRDIFWGSSDWAPQVKGGAMMPLDPRPLPELALHMATSTWGGDYRMAAPLAELLAHPPGIIPVTKGSAAEQHVARVVWHERFAAALDAAGFCRRLGLLAYSVAPSELAEMVSAVVGEPYTLGDLAKIGERIVTLERLVVNRAGAEDLLPPRWSTVPLTEGRGAGTLPPIAQMLPLYYAAHGWDEDGVPTPERLRSLDLMR